MNQTAGSALIECVPNFSEGRDIQTITAIKEAIERVEGQKLLHIDRSEAANRTVFTFAGSPRAVVDAAFEAIQVAACRIDMRSQSGTHPRVGATDVCPLIPLAHISMEQTVAWSKLLAEKIGNTLHIPVYLYEYSASADYRRSLPDIRRGEYEELYGRIETEGWAPDYGPKKVNREDIGKSGATIVGARKILVAFNISLDTSDVKAARIIARKIRSSSNGLLPELRAIGWYSQDFGCAQVSMNLLDFRVTSPLTVWNTCTLLAKELGVALKGCEVVGLIPEACIIEAGYYMLREQKDERTLTKEEIIEAGIDYLRLNNVKPFDPQEKILEYALRNAGLMNNE